MATEAQKLVAGKQSAEECCAAIKAQLDDMHDV